MPAPSAKPQPATYEDILRLAEDLVDEIVNGDLVVSPRSAPAHARARSSFAIGIGGPLDIWSIGETSTNPPLDGRGSYIAAIFVSARHSTETPTIAAVTSLSR